MWWEIALQYISVVVQFILFYLSGCLSLSITGIDNLGMWQYTLISRNKSESILNLKKNKQQISTEIWVFYFVAGATTTRTHTTEAFQTNTSC